MYVAQSFVILATGLKHIVGNFLMYFDVFTVHHVQFIIQANKCTT